MNKCLLNSLLWTNPERSTTNTFGKHLPQNFHLAKLTPYTVHPRCGSHFYEAHYTLACIAT